MYRDDDEQMLKQDVYFYGTITNGRKHQRGTFFLCYGASPLSPESDQGTHALHVWSPGKDFSAVVSISSRWLTDPRLVSCLSGSESVLCPMQFASRHLIVTPPPVTGCWYTQGPPYIVVSVNAAQGRQRKTPSAASPCSRGRKRKAPEKAGFADPQKTPGRQDTSSTLRL